MERDEALIDRCAKAARAAYSKTYETGNMIVAWEHNPPSREYWLLVAETVLKEADKL